MGRPLLQWKAKDAVATVTLDAPERMHPFSRECQSELLAALQRVREDPSIRALLLTATGAGFCVGADLDDLRERLQQNSNPSAGEYVGAMMRDSANPVIAGLRSLPVPVVCAINGVAAGGGVGLALAGDIVVAGRSAYFYFPFLPRLGAIPDMGSSWLLPRAVGRARAMGLALLGDRLTAQQAAEWGLIWQCVDDAQLQETAQQLASRLAALPAGAVQELRSLYAASESNNLEAQLALEAQRQQALIDTPAFKEGVDAFVHRRPPRFHGDGV